MKKIPLLFLLTLITGFSAWPVNPVSAAISDRDTTWWSVPEMIEFSHQVDKEKENLCQGDQACNEEFFYSMHDKGDKYRALHNFLETRVWLTSVNPGLETIKVFYFDEDIWLKNMGVEERADLTHIYFGWFDDWSGQIYNYDRNQFASGLPGLHTMYRGDEAENGPGWFPAGEEIELSATGSDLANNTSGKIDYAAFADPYFNAQGYFDISSCLNSPDYEVGEECRLMFSGDQWVSYFPPRNEIEPIANEEPTTSEVNEGGEQPTLNNLEKPIVLSENTVAISTNQADQATGTIKAPNTGSITNPCSQKTIEFPWWLMIMIALGDMIVLYLFWSQKTREKCKKGLDKKTNVR